MITTGEMQISGMLTMTVLSVMLVICAPGRSTRRISFAKARWMMAGGTGLIALQFLLQHAFGFRQMGVTQAVCCNLLFFTPSSLLCSMSILYMQRQGKVSWKEWLIGSSIYALSAGILIGTAVLDGVPFREESMALRIAEYVSSVLYVVMQTYIFSMQYKAYMRLETAVDEYYDRSRRDLFGWMGLSMKTMALMVFLVPLVIFMQGAPLVLFSISFFFIISYSTISLYTYGVSKDVERVEESIREEGIVKSEKFATADGREERNIEKFATADESNEDSAAAANFSLFTIHSTLDRWIASGHYREHNLTLSIVARQMGVPQKQLQEWLRQSEYKKLAGLVSSLRIKEAQRVLIEHRDWSVESVADYCGFNDRKYFHQVFQQYTGTTPAKFQQNN
ncbi:helix-turn-helix transcriptional regulator [Prevotella communis]|uniref:helix-turn-helix transcriptional regulator n=1 Tax=Prevotella communis TaxID=2913614 RepID=UPI001EDC7BD0|nr:helix-turn-helix transcriptional regulator [Prevotella communis]UKK60928.1 helix-turn-helix transcriptional regulator [Prevotella communis]UKK63754.1 helix-turn-helix transcriptional regulator [Prevotella communis]